MSDIKICWGFWDKYDIPINAAPIQKTIILKAGKKVNIINEIVANVVSATILSVLSLLLSIYSSFYIYSLLLSIKIQTYFNWHTMRLYHIFPKNSILNLNQLFAIM